MKFFSKQVALPEGILPALLEVREGRLYKISVNPNADERIGARTIPWMILPGLVDPHVHLDEPGRTEWEGFASGTRAAAAGGITTLVDMPLNSSPVTTLVPALEEKIAATRGKLSVNVAFHGGVIAGNNGKLDGLIRAGVAGLKAFLVPSGLDDFPAAEIEDLEGALRLIQGTKIPLLVHAEWPLASLAKAPSTRNFAKWCASRPAIMELEAIKRLIELCRAYRHPIHIVHLATGEALPMLREARAEGLPITVETCPHYLTFCSEEIPDGATEFKCTPPIRDAQNREAIWEGLRSGVIDMIVSDHSPCAPHLKNPETGDFSTAWGGIASLQLGLPAVWTEARKRGFTMDDVVRWMATKPARMMRFAGVGALLEGSEANLLFFDPEADWQVDGAALEHRHPTTPYHGKVLRGKVMETWLRGVCVYPFSDSTPSGQALLSTMDPLARFINSMKAAECHEVLEKCCGAQAWVKQMMECRPFTTHDHLHRISEKIWWSLTESDWLEAFTHHPMIGDVESLRKKFAATSQWASQEQGAVRNAAEDVLQRLHRGNQEYLAKFGYIFIVCATGKSAEEMLAILESRLPNDPVQEIRIAAGEQAKITTIRLNKLATA